MTLLTFRNIFHFSNDFFPSVADMICYLQFFQYSKQVLINTTLHDVQKILSSNLPILSKAHHVFEKATTLTLKATYKKSLTIITCCN